MKAPRTIATLAIAGVMTFSLLANPISVWASNEADILDMTAFAQENVQEKGYRVYVDGKEIRLKHSPFVDEGRVYLPARDIFSIFGYKISWDATTKLSSFISASNFFTVDTFTLAVKLNGVKIDVKMKNLNGALYVDVNELYKLVPVKVSCSEEAKTVTIVSDFKSGITLRVDDKLVTTLHATSCTYTNSTLYVGASLLEHMLPESDVFMSNSYFSISSPIDGSFTKIMSDGSIEYSASGSNDVLKLKLPVNNVFYGSGENRKLNINMLSKYTSYTVNVTIKNELLYIDVISNWYGSDLGEEFLLLIDEDVPLSDQNREISGFYKAPEKEPNAVVRDTGYIVNTVLHDEIAKEINLYRANAGLSVLTVNHSLVYKDHNNGKVGRSTVFDNLRWCRENLPDRNLEHTSLSVGHGEILMSNSKSSATAIKLVNTWYNSVSHRAIMMHKDAVEFGILVIQYPNGDIDVASIFCIE